MDAAADKFHVVDSTESCRKSEITRGVILNHESSDTETASESERSTTKPKTSSVRIQATGTVRSHHTQTDDKEEEKKDLVAEAEKEIEELRKSVRRAKVGLLTLPERPNTLQFYTGLDDYNVVKMISNSIAPFLLNPLNLTKEQVFFHATAKITT